MFWEILLAIVIGVHAGIFTGLVPGIHVNLVTVLVVASAATIPANPFIICCFIIALAITHSFIDAIPSIYLGAPDPDMALAALPGHRMLLEGKGHLAIKLTLIGSGVSLLFCLCLLPFFIFLMGILQERIRGAIPYVLLFVVFYMIFREENHFSALGTVMLAGTLGWIVLEFPNLNQPLFPLLSGLFGCSLLLLSSSSGGIPAQTQHANMALRYRTLGKAGIVSSVTGFIAAFLPGFGSSQAAIIAQQVTGDIGDEGFLALVGGINTANMLVSIGTAYALEKARNGAIVGVLSLIGEVSFPALLSFVIVALISGGLAVMLALRISTLFCSVIQRIPYRSVVIGVLCFIFVLSIIFDGVVGMLILIAATALGIFASKRGIGKNHLMACLIIPVIIYLW